MVIEHSSLIWPILFTGLAPLFIWLLRGNINAREGVSFAAGALTFGTVLTFVPAVLNGEVFCETMGGMCNSSSRLLSSATQINPRP